MNSEYQGEKLYFAEKYKNLDKSEKYDLTKIRDTYWECGEMSMIKECLRNIYAITETIWEAEITFIRWCKLAVETRSKELKTMGKQLNKDSMVL